MKTKILAVTAVALIGGGTYMHSGHKPICLMQLFASKKTEVKAQPSTAALADNSLDLKEKKHHHPNHDAKP